MVDGDGVLEHTLAKCTQLCMYPNCNQSAKRTGLNHSLFLVLNWGYDANVPKTSASRFAIVTVTC